MLKHKSLIAALLIAGCIQNGEVQNPETEAASSQSIRLHVGCCLYMADKFLSSKETAQTIGLAAATACASESIKSIDAQLAHAKATSSRGVYNRLLVRQGEMQRNQDELCSLSALRYVVSKRSE